MNLGEIEEDTGNVLNSWIADGSRDNYDGLNIKLIIGSTTSKTECIIITCKPSCSWSWTLLMKKTRLPSRKRVRNQRKEATWEIPVVRHFTVLSSVIILRVQSNRRRYPFKLSLNTCRHSRRRQRGRKQFFDWVRHLMMELAQHWRICIQSLVSNKTWIQLPSTCGLTSQAIRKVWQELVSKNAIWDAFHPYMATKTVIIEKIRWYGQYYHLGA